VKTIVNEDSAPHPRATTMLDPPLAQEEST